MPRVAKGHVEQLPSGSWRARVYAGVDPITQREIRLKATAKTEQEAYIELGRLLKQASEGRTPESSATLAKLLDEYAAIAPWDVSTRQTNEGFIRRTIKPALGHLEVRKVRGPILDQLYARLKRCGDLSCTGRAFIEHRNIPVLTINSRDPRPAWQQVHETLTEAIQSGRLAPGDELASITELSALQGIGTGVIRRALEQLAADGLIVSRRGQTPIVAGTASPVLPGARKRPGPGHDCRRAGCKPHVCHPMKASTIRGIHSILSGAFAAAQRWEWTDRNPAESAKPPTTIRQPIPATSPDDVATVIAEARTRSTALGLYLWLAVVTGVRRGELCGLQIRDVDLDRGLIHVAFNYVVRGGQRVRKDTKTHQDRWLAIDPDTCALIATHLDEIRAELAAVGIEMRKADRSIRNPDQLTLAPPRTADTLLTPQTFTFFSFRDILQTGREQRGAEMSTRAASGEATTYLLEGSQLAEVMDFVAELARRGVAVPEPKPALVGADGRRLEVPGLVFDALVQVATAMAHGQGVTVIPQNALLTTQEAAELLGISRPTLVRLLEAGEIPYEQRGRHRRIMLADLLAYQAKMRRERREALDRMAQEGQAAGLYEATAGPPPRTRLPTPMAMFPAFLDTCTLYGAYLCDSLLRLAEAGTYRPLWSAGVLDELEQVLVARGLAEEAVKYRIGEMRRALPDAEVRGYENIVETMTCDPKDRHVLAAAVRGDAAALVTFNIDDFPDISTAAYDITVVHPDDFLLDQLDLYPGYTIAALRDQGRSYSAPAMSIEDLLGRLASASVPKFAAEARRHL